jgi:dienelactone hydrolase
MVPSSTHALTRYADLRLNARMITTSAIPYHGDGLRMLGYLAIDDARSGARPAVLLAPEAPGLDDFNRQRCTRLAALGYAAFGLDPHGEGEVITDRGQITARLETLMADPMRIRSRAQSALSALRSQPRIDGARVAAIGYCFGGTTVLELARSGADVRAVIGFHAGLRTARPQDAKNIRAKVLICNGVQDPIVPLEQRTAFEQEMEAGGVDWQLHLYGGTGHAFTRPGAAAMGLPGFAYNKSADERSWQTMLDLFAETLGPV